MIRIPLKHLDKMAPHRPPGYRAEMLAAGAVNGDVVEIQDVPYLALMKKFRGTRKRGLGDIVEALAKPIAKAFRMDCLDSSGNLKPDSRCAQRKDALNKAVPRIGN